MRFPFLLSALCFLFATAVTWAQNPPADAAPAASEPTPPPAVAEPSPIEPAAPPPPTPPLDASSAPIPGLPPPPTASPVFRPTQPTLSPPVPEEMINGIRLPDAPLDGVIDQLERWTGRVVLRPQALPQATVRLNITTPLPKSEAILALESALALNNIGVIPMGERFLKIVELVGKARTEAPELLTDSAFNYPASGRTAAKIFELTFLKAAEFVPQLNTLLNNQLGGGIVFSNSNYFMVTDSISNLQRVERLIADLDRPAALHFLPKFYNLSFAKASDLATRIQTLVQSPALQAQMGNNFTLSADDRTNQLVLIADRRQQPFFDDLVAKFDTKADPNTRTEVIRLNNADAELLTTTLTSLITGQTTAAARTGGTTGGSNTVRRPNTPNNPNNPATRNQPTQPTPQPNPAISGGTGTGNAATEFSGILSIIADKRTNSVIVSGTVDDIRLATELITKLDGILAQVRIEIVIAQVTLSNNSTSGISALGLTVSGNHLTGFSGNGPGTAVTDGTIAYPAGGGVDLAAKIGLTSNSAKGNATVLSVPTITTTHNKEASIFIGETRPTITGITSSTAVGSTPGASTSTINQQEVGTTITVTPLIGADGSVQLDLEQEISEVGEPVTIDNNVQNVINRRKTQSFVTARSGEILVLGGLQRETKGRTKSRIGPIPLLGDLFGSRVKDNTRTELIFFLRPTILTNTAADNAEALQQVDRLLNRDAVIEALKPPATTPPAAVQIQLATPTDSAPTPAPAESTASPASTRRGPR